MTEHTPDDLDPTGRDLREYTDELRPAHPVVRNSQGQYVLLRHADVVAAAVDADTFSSAVSAHRALPNSLDGEEHRAYRRLIDAYLTDAEVAAQAGEVSR